MAGLKCFPAAVTFSPGEREIFHEQRDAVLQPYIPILVLIVFVVLNAILLLGTGLLLGALGSGLTLRRFLQI